MRRLTACLFAATIAGAAFAQPLPADPNRPAEDIARDPARRPAEMLAFAHIGPGMKVVDFIPGHGYFTRMFAAAVKPGGTVVADVPTIAAEHDPAGAAAIGALNATYGNVTVIANLTDPAVRGADVVWTAQNYHDIHNAPPEMLPAVNKAIFNALKPGGYYVIVDHVAAPGAPANVTSTLHRIDPAVVKAEVTAAGFVFDGETKVLANPADDHSKNVFDPAIRGHTDQFAYRCRKPA
ncbi:MAG: class I SAM-dependent methyltransferase [Sphingomonadaceae bacterium]|nr:class I SAM-dependent methyltransferase [Sphingomonadaceae bacterium]